MLVHLVLFAPRPGLTRQEEGALAAAFERAVGDIPTVRSARVGRRVRHGASYEDGAGDYPYAALLEFDDLAGLQAYLNHPAHRDLGARFQDSLRDARVFDYDTGDASAIRAWLDGGEPPRSGRVVSDL